MVYDVIVVGLGPAGATTAYELSSAGLKTLALEKEKLPRYKPCAGGLSLKIEKVLSFPDWRPLIINTVYDLILSYKEENAERFHSDLPLAYMVNREQFDFYLAEKALSAGTEIHEQERVITVVEKEENVEIKTEKQTYLARFIIGADGYPSCVARSLCAAKVEKDGAWFSAISEVEAEVNPDTHLDSAIYIYFGSIPNGYGWIFPKKERYGLGIAGLLKDLKHPRQQMFEFIETQPYLKNIKSGKIYTRLVPAYRELGQKRSTARALLVGDAAGLVDPFLGEGIYYAVRSGQIAAQVIQNVLAGKTQSLMDYPTLIQAEIGKELQVAQVISDAVYRVPAVSYHLFKFNPYFFGVYRSVLAGEKSYSELYAEVRNKVSALFSFKGSPKS